MISILVPVFNTNVCGLAQSLSEQLQLLNIQGEIIFADDASDSSIQEANEPISKLPFVHYKKLPVNQGRQGIRIFLAGMASFDQLLFLDADSIIIKKDFLQTYLSSIGKTFDVLVGGRVYSDEKPSQCHKMLHWKYGKERENIASGRTAFMTNNFYISKKLYLDIPHLENLKGYGHEDTWMGIQLQERKLSVGYIDNPVLHNGLEETDIFLEKSRNALNNLHVIAGVAGAGTLERHVRIYHLFRIVKNTRSKALVIFIYKLLRKRIERNLYSCTPSLKAFDYYRLCQLLYQDRH